MPSRQHLVQYAENIFLAAAAAERTYLFALRCHSVHGILHDGYTIYITKYIYGSVHVHLR